MMPVWSLDRKAGSGHPQPPQSGARAVRRMKRPCSGCWVTSQFSILPAERLVQGVTV